jgi:2-(1,2-epoxy-1,2-dihydrophenyl)acetyl-CoA isomerase
MTASDSTPATSTADPTVLYTTEGAVAVVTLNRPQALNSFTRQMHRELWAALDKAEADPQIRALVITGAGRGFSPLRRSVASMECVVRGAVS